MEEGLTSITDHPGLVVLRARLHALSANTVEAEKDLNTVLQKAPGYTDAHGVRALLRLAQRDWEGARQSADAALKLNDTQPQALLALAQLDASERKIAEALAKFERNAAAPCRRPRVVRVAGAFRAAGLLDLGGNGQRHREVGRLQAGPQPVSVERGVCGRSWVDRWRSGSSGLCCGCGTQSWLLEKWLDDHRAEWSNSTGSEATGNAREEPRLDAFLDHLLGGDFTGPCGCCIRHRQPGQSANYTWLLTNTVPATCLQTHGGDNRNNGTADHAAAMLTITGYFTSYGLATSYHTFGSGGYGTNVVATLPGIGPNASRIYLIGAHYDSVNCPGADDNASGVAAVLEAARILSQYRFRATLQFIAFDQEEDGLFGSTAYSTLAVGRGDDIRGMLSLDMIAFNPAGANQNKLRLYSRDNSLRTDVTQAVTTYSGGLTPVWSGWMGYSDHAPFDSRGYPAGLLIEHSWNSNPNYHKVTDSVDSPGYLDYQFATRATRSVVGWLATMAELQAVPEPALFWLWAVGLGLIGLRHRPQRDSHW